MGVFLRGYDFYFVFNGLLYYSIVGWPGFFFSPDKVCFNHYYLPIRWGVNFHEIIKAKEGDFSGGPVAKTP